MFPWLVELSSWRAVGFYWPASSRDPQAAGKTCCQGRQLESPWLPSVERSERQLTEGLQFPVACGRRSASLRPAGTVAFIE